MRDSWNQSTNVALRSVHRHPPGTSRPPSQILHPPPPSRGDALRVAIVLSFAHAVNDSFTSFLAPLLPRIMERLDITIALASVLSMTLSIATSLPQPAVGYLSDRVGRRLFVIVGPLMTGAVLSLMGFAPTFAALMALLVIGGIGSALFHPPGVSLAARASEGRGSGVRFSVFSFGGTLGYAIGPLVAVAIVGRRGLEGLWVAVFAAVAASALVWALVPADAPARSRPPPPSPAAVLRHLMGPLGSLFWISAIGAFVQRTYLTLQPISVAQAGGSEAVGALSLTVYLGAQAAGTVSGGWLADRVSRTHLLAWLMLLATPAHILAVVLPPGSAGALTAAAFAGFLNMATLPPLVVMAQEVLPGAASAAAGIAMGLAWATGSVAVMGVGVAADMVGPVGAQVGAMPVLLVASLVALGKGLRPFARPSHGPG
ncbi:MAG: MFS transporter [Gemmatimonadota bacterium]|nr:MFS transporter [Gemmatimonadota bacterium]